MKKLVLLTLVLVICLLGVSHAFAEEGEEAAKATKPAESNNELVIADFDTGDKPNNLGGDFGSWDKDPNDDTQFCRMSFESDDSKGDKTGYSLRLDYDVDSPNPAYNGLWLRFNNVDATPYNTLSFYVKGDGVKGFTKRIKIELKDSAGSSPYILTGITDKWQKFSVPFEKFRKITNWKQLTEIVIVFDDINTSPKIGTVYFDQVTLSAE